MTLLLRPLPALVRHDVSKKNVVKSMMKSKVKKVFKIISITTSILFTFWVDVQHLGHGASSCVLLGY